MNPTAPTPTTAAAMAAIDLKLVVLNVFIALPPGVKDDVKLTPIRQIRDSARLPEVHQKWPDAPVPQRLLRAYDGVCTASAAKSRICQSVRLLGGAEIRSWSC